jgi:hypothetical protein
LNKSSFVRPSPWDHCGSNKLLNKRKNSKQGIGKD